MKRNATRESAKPKDRKTKGKESVSPSAPTPRHTPPPLDSGAPEFSDSNNSGKREKQTFSLAARSRDLCRPNPFSELYEEGRKLWGIPKELEPLNRPLTDALIMTAIIQEAPELLFRTLAEVRGLLPLWEATCLLPGYGKALKSFQDSLSAIPSDEISAADTGDMDGEWQRLVALALRVDPASTHRLVAACDLSNWPKFKQRVKKIRARANRKDDSTPRANAVREPMLFAWVPAALWLCDEEAGVALLNRCFPHVSINVVGNAFGTHRRTLKPGGLWWQKPAGIVIGTATSKPALSLKLRAELKALGANVDAVNDCLAL